MTPTTLFRTLMCSGILLSINCFASTLIQNVRVINGNKIPAARHVLIDHGKIIDAGTSAGNIGTQFGISVHRQMAPLEDAGLSHIDALRYATSVTTRAFRIKDQGMTATGYKVDLLLVDGYSMNHIHATRRIVEVWKDGEAVSPILSKKLQEVAQEKASKQVLVALPADLSDANTLKFKDKVKGKGAKFQVGFMMQAIFIPSNITFTATSDWQEVGLPFIQFKGMDSGIVTMLSFNAGSDVGLVKV